MGSPATKAGPRLRGRVPWLLRRGWVIVVCVILVVAVAGVASRHQRATYSATSILLVNPGATGASPGGAQEAGALATTYAGLIPNDSAVVSAVASATGLTPSEVSSATTVTVTSGTSILNVRFTASTPTTALRGADAMADAVSGKHPVTATIPSGAVFLMQHPASATRHLTSKSTILGLSVLLGLLLGAVLTIIWERADARFDKPEQVTDELGIPARSSAALSDESALAIMRQWRSLALHRMGVVEGHAPRVALVPATPRAAASVTSLAEMLVASALRGSMRVSASIADARSEDLAPQNPWSSGSDLAEGGGSRNGAQDRELYAPPASPSSPDLELLVGGQPGGEGGEAVSQQAHVTVLVIPVGSRVREVRRVVSLLAELGSLPVWAIMPTSVRRSSIQRPYSANDRTSSDAGLIPEPQLTP